MWTVSLISQELECEIKVNGQTGEGNIHLRFSESKGTESVPQQVMHAHTTEDTVPPALFHHLINESYSGVFFSALEILNPGLHIQNDTVVIEWP